MGDKDRAAILARRQRFLSLALTGLALGCGEEPVPQPCLSAIPDDQRPVPRPCLEIKAPDEPNDQVPTPEDEASKPTDESSKPTAEAPSKPADESSKPSTDGLSPDVDGATKRPTSVPTPCLRVIRRDPPKTAPRDPEK